MKFTTSITTVATLAGLSALAVGAVDFVPNDDEGFAWIKLGDTNFATVLGGCPAKITQTSGPYEAWLFGLLANGIGWYTGLSAPKNQYQVDTQGANPGDTNAYTYWYYQTDDVNNAAAWEVYDKKRNPTTDNHACEAEADWGQAHVVTTFSKTSTMKQS